MDFSKENVPKTRLLVEIWKNCRMNTVRYSKNKATTIIVRLLWMVIKSEDECRMIVRSLQAYEGHRNGFCTLSQVFNKTVK